MATINLVAADAAALKYLIPLSGHLDGDINMCLFPNGKYNDALKAPSVECANKYASQMGYTVVENKMPGGHCVVIEGCGREHLNENHGLVFSIVYLLDFRGLYEKYIDQVDRVIFPIKEYTEYYGHKNEKNRYLGCPKYDVTIHPREVRNRYGITEESVVVVAPRNRDVSKIDLKRLYNTLRDMGKQIIVTTRGKDPVTKDFRGDIYLQDHSWYPHATMEAIAASELVINFDSTTTEEAMFLRTPVINFRCKPFPLQMPWLYEQQNECWVTQDDTNTIEARRIQDFIDLDRQDSDPVGVPIAGASNRIAEEIRQLCRTFNS
jgi:hypothetical protein